jgi:hypothetical protein
VTNVDTPAECTTCHDHSALLFQRVPLVLLRHGVRLLAEPSVDGATATHQAVLILQILTARLAIPNFQVRQSFPIILPIWTVQSRVV